ncbi:hypothetical protein D9611_012959 [Ephemerocybe angulata]|uniref:G domain-containing protein n=1 Tax=Ephemerocybe angulata TaxID=980116 RepID=A0A8H5C5Z7_9AGAR|nr:hypothetical protein D9611_012959 [Tulosesus angulatus]
MSNESKERTIVVIGKFDAGKTTFIKAVRDAANIGIIGSPVAEETPTLSIEEYNVPLLDGQTLTFLDTPGFDGYQAGSESAKTTEEILQMLEEHLGVNGPRTVSHVLFFLNAIDTTTTELKGRARRTFERLFPNSKVVYITTRWDQVENDDGLPVTVEEAKSKEESIYAGGRTSGSLLEYLHDNRENRGDALRFRSGLPIDAYSSPHHIIQKLFTTARQVSDAPLEISLVATTEENEDLNSKCNLLLREKEVFLQEKEAFLQEKRVFLQVKGAFLREYKEMAEQARLEAEAGRKELEAEMKHSQLEVQKLADANFEKFLKEREVYERKVKEDKEQAERRLPADIEQLKGEARKNAAGSAEWLKMQADYQQRLDDIRDREHQAALKAKDQEATLLIEIEKGRRQELQEMRRREQNNPFNQKIYDLEARVGQKDGEEAVIARFHCTKLEMKRRIIEGGPALDTRALNGWSRRLQWTSLSYRYEKQRRRKGLRPRKRSKGWKIGVFDVRLSSVLTPASGLSEVKRLHAVKVQKPREEEAMRRQQEFERFEAEQIRAKEHAERDKKESGHKRMEKEEQERIWAAEIEEQKFQARVAERIAGQKRIQAEEASRRRSLYMIYQLEDKLNSLCRSHTFINYGAPPYVPDGLQWSAPTIPIDPQLMEEDRLAREQRQEAAANTPNTNNGVAEQVPVPPARKRGRPRGTGTTAAKPPSKKAKKKEDASSNKENLPPVQQTPGPLTPLSTAPPNTTMPPPPESPKPSTPEPATPKPATSKPAKVEVKDELLESMIWTKADRTALFKYFLDEGDDQERRMKQLKVNRSEAFREVCFVSDVDSETEMCM